MRATAITSTLTIKYMKSDKKLRVIYDRAKGDKGYYSFHDFKDDAKSFLKDVRNRNIVTGMEVSRSGMLRKFNTKGYNAFLNICYNEKYDWNVVRVGGCGMDMWWHLLYTACQSVATKGEVEKWRLNSLCSSQTVL